jgi:hypothetical protein
VLSNGRFGTVRVAGEHLGDEALVGLDLGGRIRAERHGSICLALTENPLHYYGGDYRAYLGGWISRTLGTLETKTCQVSALRSQSHAHATTLRPI